MIEAFQVIWCPKCGNAMDPLEICSLCGGSLPEEQRRVREHVLPMYESLRGSPSTQATNRAPAAPVQKIPRKGKNMAVEEFKILANVTVPTRPVKAGEPAYVFVRSEIVRDTKSRLDEEPKTVHVLPCVDMETGEECNIIAGIILVDALEKYKGGKLAYVGRGFRLLKEDGKPNQAKKWHVHEVAVRPEISAPYIVDRT